MTATALALFIKPFVVSAWLFIYERIRSLF